MAELKLTQTRIQAGVWQGILVGTETVPELGLMYQGEFVGAVELSEDPDSPGRFLVSAPIPSQYLSEGVQTFLLVDRATDEDLASFTIVTGHPLSEDFRAEMSLLREELDMLKRAFRRHCVETAS